MWEFSASLDPARTRELRDPPPFETIVSRIKKVVSDDGQQVLCCHSESAENIPGAYGFARVVYCLRLSPVMFDLFFNSASGYRAAYYRSPFEGMQANEYVLRSLVPVLLYSSPTQTIQTDRTFIYESLTSPTAKVWLVEEGKERCEHCQPEWASHRDETPEILNGRWEKTDKREAIWGRKAPYLTKLRVMGAFLNDGYDEIVPAHKKHRAWHIHAFGLASPLRDIPSRYIMPIQKVFAMRLKQVREAAGLTQAVLAHKTKLSLSYVARLEQGRHDPPLSTLAKLAKALRCKVSELVE